MKKNTKITLWVIGALAVSTGLVFVIKSLMKKKANKKFQAELLEKELKKKSEAELEQTKIDTLLVKELTQAQAPDVKNSKADVPPIGETTTLTQAQANAIAYKIQKMDKMLKSSRFSKPSDKTKIEREISSLKQTLLKGGYTYSEGKAVKNVG